MSDGCVEHCGLCSLCRVAELEANGAAQSEEIAALRQRAEAAERERDQWRSAAMIENQKRRVAESERAAQSDLKRTAYAVLDDVRKVVEETIIPALEDVDRMLKARQEQCFHSRAREVLEETLAAARKTLTDAPVERE